MKVVSKLVQIGQGSQDITFREIVTIGKEKCEIKIKSDSYDFQSFARLSIYNPDQKAWNVIATIPYSEMGTQSKLYYKYSNNYKNSQSEFQVDRNALIDQAKIILE